jgi:hypothetical protein
MCHRSAEAQIYASCKCANERRQWALRQQSGARQLDGGGSGASYCFALTP